MRDTTLHILKTIQQTSTAKTLRISKKIHQIQQQYFSWQSIAPRVFKITRQETIVRMHNSNGVPLWKNE